MCHMVGGGMTNSRGNQRNLEKTLLQCRFAHDESLMESHFCFLQTSVVPSYNMALNSSLRVEKYSWIFDFYMICVQKFKETDKNMLKWKILHTNVIVSRFHCIAFNWHAECFPIFMLAFSDIISCCRIV